MTINLKDKLPVNFGIFSIEEGLENANFGPLFQVKGEQVFLLPELIKYPEAMLPVMELIAKTVRDLILRTSHLQQTTASEDKLKAQAQLDDDILRFVLGMNLKLRGVIATIILKEELLWEADENLINFMKDFDIKNEEELRNFTRKLILNALRLRLFKNQSKICNQLNINAGQLSSFLSKNGNLSLDKIQDLIKLMCKAALEQGILEKLKSATMQG